MKNQEKQKDSTQYVQTVGYKLENWSPKQKPPHTSMQGNYCVLKPLDNDLHSPLLFEALNSNDKNEIWTYLPFGPFDSAHAFKEWLREDSLSKMFFSIIETESGDPQGLASYHDINQVHGVIEVGSIIYSKKLQKTSAGTEAMYLMSFATDAINGVVMH
jgi:RimJ/RimL family protein N-acetyltransferase